VTVVLPADVDDQPRKALELHTRGETTKDTPPPYT
jgi:hypothetical protein